MPTAEQFLAEDIRIRPLLYGPAKAKKTWWVLKAAEAGYRVLLIDTDKGQGIVKNIAPEARKNIYFLNIADGPQDAFAATFLVLFLRDGWVYLNEKTRQVALTPFPGARLYDCRSFGRDTIICFDSYTRIVNSVERRFAFENNIDLAAADKQDWEGYGWCGRLLNWMIYQMGCLPCNVCLIAHETQWEKRKKVKGGKEAQKHAPVEFVRRQVISSSNPHGMSVGSNFADILYFYSEGRSFYIDAMGSQLEDGGGCTVPPARYLWDVDPARDDVAPLPFYVFADAAGLPRPENVEPFDFPEVEIKVAPPPMIKPVIAAPNTAQVAQRTSTIKLS